MKATDMLKKQHREVEGLFAQVKKAKDGAGQRPLVEEIEDKPRAHVMIEERVQHMRASSTRRVTTGRAAPRGRWQRDTQASPLEERVGTAIVAAARAFAEPRWRQWVERWLDGADRSEAAARDAFAIADAEVETRGAGPAPPAFAIPAVAARTAAQLAIGFARVEALQRVGEVGIARSLEHITAAMAEQVGSSVSARATVN